VAVSVLDIQVNSQGAVRSLNQVGAASNAAESAFRKLDGVFGSLAASFAAGFAINKIISDVKELDTNIRRLGTVGVDVQKINPALAALSDRLGGVANKADLAASSYQAASAGFADTAGNIRILEAATKAATGGLADNQAVTEVLVKTLNAYGMSGTQAYEVTDSISKAVELGNQEWSDYTSQLGRVVSMAALAGVSLDEMNAFIAAATKNGATAEVAFTGLSSVLTQLLQPTKESKDAAARLNIQWDLMGLKTKGLGGLMKELAVAIDKDKEAAARMVGPTEAMRGAFAAASKDGKDFEGILKQLGDASGKTDADFQTMKGSLENTFKALDTSFKNLSEALGKAFGPTLVITIQDITKGVNGFATVMSAVPQPVMEATGELIKFIVQMVLVQKAIQSVIALNAGITALFASTASGAAIAGGAAATATPLVNGLALALGRLAALGIITVGVNYVSNVVGEAMSLRQLQERRAKGGAAASFKGATRETVVAAQAAQRKNLVALAKKEKARKDKLAKDNALYQVPIIGPLALAAASPFIAGEQNKLFEQQQFSQGVLGLDPSKFKPSKPAAKPTATPPPTSTGGSGGSDSKPKKDTAADEAARLKNSLGSLGIEYSLKKQIYGIDNKIFEANLRNDKETAIRLEGEKKLADINASIAKLEFDKLKPLEKQGKIADLLLDKTIAQRDTQQQLITNQVQVAQQAEAAIRPLIDEGELLKAKLAGTEQQYQKELLIDQILNGNSTLRREEVTAIVEKNQALQQQLTQAEQLKAVYSDIGMTIKSGVIDSIQGAIDGTKSLGEVAANVLTNIANKLLDIAVNMSLFGAMSGTGTGGGLLGGLFKGSGGGGGLGSVASNIAQYAPLEGLAAGGPVSAGTPYMVGERGPELFMPSRGGSIIPNNALGGGSTSVVVNVDASGSSVQGDQAQSRQLGVAISAAVQAELVKQQRPGGLLAGTR